MGYTIGQASTATGRTKSAISKAIQSGRITAHKQDDGSYDIDPAELHRVYPPVSNSPETSPSTPTPLDTETLLRLREAEVRLEESEKRHREKDQTLADLRQERDSWKQQATALLTAAPTHQTGVVTKAWRWLFGPPSPGSSA